MANYQSLAAKGSAIGKAVAGAVDSGLTVARVVSPASITRLAKDSIFQFPMFVSASIDTDEIYVITKNVERNYAALMASVFSLYGYVDLSKYGSLVEYLKKFHSNGNIGGKLGFAGESVGEEAVDPMETVLESAVIDTTSTVTDVNVASLWDSVTESLDTECLNQMYQPYKRTETLIGAALETARSTIATEAGKGPQANDYVNVGLAKVKGAGDFASDNAPKYTVDSTDKDGNPVSKPKIKESDKNFNAIVRDDATSNMTPTMVNLSFVMDANGNGATWKQNVVIGIKGMVRMIRSNNMIANMVEACKDRTIFKFINWTKGELNAAQIVLGTNQIEEGKRSNDKETYWMKALKRRKPMRWANFAAGRTLLPNATVILTEQEALEIKNQCGMDIGSASVAAKVIKQYFLLGIGIYDTEGKVLDMMYDGDSSFSSASLRSLVAENKKETNLLAMNKY